MDKTIFKRLKTIFLILAICASLLCLFACGGGYDDDDDDGYGDEYPRYISVIVYTSETETYNRNNVWSAQGSDVWTGTRVGYTLLGLFDSPQNGVMMVNPEGYSLYDLIDGAVLYAHWEKARYETSFVVEEHGTIDETSSFYVELGDRIETLPLPEVDEGYEFVGWAFSDGSLISNGEDVIEKYQDANEENSFWLSNGAFKAIIKQKKIKLTLDYNLDTDNYTENFDIVYGESIGEIEPLADDDENYMEFIGWSLSPMSYIPYTDDASLEYLTEDVTLYAYWQRYKPVSFVYEGYEDVYRVYENQSFTMPTPDIPGKKLDAWFASPVFNTLPVSSINYYSAMDIYYAKMSVATYSIKFQTNGSENLLDLSYRMGDELSLPVLQREHFTFDGWCLKEDLSDTPITEITFDMYGNLVLYPKFTGESVSVNLNVGAGYLAQTQINVEYYAKNMLPIPTLDGYAFIGWYFDEALTDRLTNENGESLEIWDTLESGLTLYAKYSKKYYVTISDAPNGSFTSNLKPYYVEGELVNLEITPSSEYAFGGIYREGKLVSKTPAYSFYMTAKNVDFSVKLTRVGNITVTVGGHGATNVTLNVPKTAKEGERISITYQTNDYNKERYGINKIVVNGIEVKLDKTLSFIMPNGDANVEITFGYKRYLEIDTGDTGIVIYEQNGHYYAFINKQMTWDAAKAYCENFGGHLVTITSDQESEFVSSVRTINSAFTSNVWIGATDKDSEGNWKWVTGEKFSNFLHWNSGEPSNSNGNEHYAHLTSGTKYWNDNDVGEKFYFICEWDNENEMKFPDVKKVVDINGEELLLTLHENNGHYYSIFTTPMSWKAAEKYCEYLGGYLVCIETESENVYIRNLRELIASYSDNVWIGATDEALEGTWRWINGQSVNFTSWASSQPDNASNAEHFAHLYATSKALTWNDAPGAKEYMFICEWDKKTDVGKIRYGNFFNVIETREQFISALQNQSITDGHIYELRANIDLSGYVWTPKDFAGTFIGNGYTVSNLTVDASDGNLGMFLKLSGSISDLKFKNLIVNSTSLSTPLVGGICAELTGSIKNVEIQSGIISAKGTTGGLVGKMTGGEIIGCINRASVSSSVNTGVGAGTGGIVGVATAGVIDNCQNYAKVEGGAYTGGIVGTTADNSSLALSRLKNSGQIISSGDYAGGIAGFYSRRGSYDIIAFENTGKISALSYAGGIFGRFNNSSDAKDNGVYTLLLENLKNSGEITASNDYAGGIVGYLYAEYYRSGYSGSVVLTMIGMQNTGDVFGRYYVGGIAGKIFSDSSESVFTQSASSASISATAYVGGLMGRTDNLCIKNSSNAGTVLTASGSYVDGSSNYAYFGGYVGYAAKSNIIGVRNEVGINYSSLSCIGSYVGGIAGYSTGTFTDCTNNAEIYAPAASYVGGIAGDCEKAYTYSMSNIRNTGTVHAKTYVGGIFGKLYSYISSEKNSNIYNVEFNSIVNTAEIFALEDYAGGLFGYFYLGHWYSSSYDGKYITFINSSENTGKVTGRYFVGGIMGYGLTDATESTMGSVKNSSDIVADAYAGCIAGYLDRFNLLSPSNAGSTLTLKGTYVASSTKYAYVGGYVGNAINLTISDAENSVLIDYSSPLCQGINVGGIAGSSTGLFVRCKNTAAINAPFSENVAGICANLTKTGTYALSDLENTGAITGKGTVGGIFGRIYAVDEGKHSNTYTVNLSSLKNTASITANGDYAGGIFAYFYFSNYYNSSYNGKVILFITEAVNEANVTGQNYVGGLIGYGYTDTSDSTMSSSRSSGAITANAYAGGIAGKLERLNIVSTSNEGTSISVSGTLDVSGTKYACIGGYVGSYQNSTITGAVNNANIDYSSALSLGYEVGGIVGASTSILIDCENRGTVYAPYASYVGGIAGSLYITGSYDVSGLTNTANVTGKDLVGGIFGYVKNETSDKSNPTYVMNFTKLKNSADVTASNESAGALIGKVSASHYYSSSYNGTVSLYISESEAAGNVYAVKYSGGYIGYADTDSSLSTIFSSAISATATGEESVGEYFGYSDNFTVSS
jgi:hypothetical protein